MSQTERFDDAHFLSLSSTKSIKPGHVIGGTYVLKSLLGQGGMGYVFRAEHNIIKKDYALKIIRPDKLDDFSWQRFEIEGRVIAKLDHPNIVKIYNMGVEEDNCPYYVMDLLAGSPLSEYINRDDGLTFAQCLDIFHQVAQGLDYAHKKGIVHRDIKPSNFIMLEENGAIKAKIVDFGLAKIIDPGVGRAHLQAITAKGQIFGSPYYMSPEQCQGERIDHRSDIYSLGCALYESISGEAPFIGASAIETLMMHTDAAMPKLADRFSEGPAAAVDSLLAKMMAKNPADRIQSMAEVAAAIERLGKRAPLLSLSIGQGKGDADIGSDSTDYLDDSLSDSSNSSVGGRSTIGTSKSDAKWLLVGCSLVIVAIGVVLTYIFRDKLFPSSKVAVLPPEVAAIVAFGPIKSHASGTSGGRVYDFPHTCIGSVTNLQTYKSKRAVDSVYLDNAGMVTFVANEGDVPVIYKYPQIFAQIDKNDFFGLELEARGSMVTLRDNATYNKEFNEDGLGRTAIIEFSQKQMIAFLKIALSWTNLRALTLDNFTVNDEVFNLVEKMPYVNKFVLKRSTFDVKELAGHDFLRRLNYLRLQDPMESFVDPILLKLAGSHNLVDLYLDDVEFSISSFAQLKRCSNLKRLGLNKVEISDQMINIIGEMKSLRSFSSDGVKLTDSQILALSKMKNLRVVLDACCYAGKDENFDRAKMKAYRAKFPTIVFH